LKAGYLIERNLLNLFSACILISNSCKEYFETTPDLVILAYNLTKRMNIYARVASYCALVDKQSLDAFCNQQYVE